MSSNKFLSFNNDIINTNSSSTFIVGSTFKVLSSDITTTDEFIELPDATLANYDVIHYRKLMQTPRDIIFTYKGLQKAKLHYHRQQTVIFNKFKTTTTTTWIY
jgi:hypothetical protein